MNSRRTFIGLPRTNQTSFFFSSLVLCCWNAFGQTNSSPAPLQALFLPPLQLRALSSDLNEFMQWRDNARALRPFTDRNRRLGPEKSLSKVAEVSPGISLLPNPSHSPEEMALSSDDRDLEIMYRRLEQRGYLTWHEPKSENRFVRYTDAIFRPEVVRVGNVSVGCSIITAIKRKNPLCLFNPIVLHVSW